MWFKRVSALILALAVVACGDAEPAPTPVETPPVAATSTPAPEAVASETASNVAVEYVAGGNEPFWSITTEAARMVYSSPEKLEGESLSATMSQADGWTRFSGQMDGAPLVLEVRKATCQDDMSGFAFSHEARLTRGEGTFRGCARLASEPQPRE